MIDKISVSTSIKDERDKEENRIRRYNHILEGINRIFNIIVQVKSEEELGEACLSVALEITSSQFGFIIEIGDDGLLHDVAKSQLAWEQCHMYDKIGHVCLPRDYVIHGLYGSVIINEKSFFTNDPQSHPDSAGLPTGHPPIKSFLGVPLILDGKTIGSIAVANREGGYTYEQQEDLEAIAPAITQTLKRKREEKKRERVEKEMCANEERFRALVTASSEALYRMSAEWDELLQLRIPRLFTDTENPTRRWIDKYIPSVDHPLVIAAINEAVKKKSIFELEHKVWRADGKLGCVFSRAVPILNSNGEIFEWFGSATDITERKKAEEALKSANETLEAKIKERIEELEKAYNALKESEEKYRNIIETANEGIAIIDSRCIVTFANKKLSKLLNYTEEEIIGKSAFDLIEDAVAFRDKLKERQLGVNDNYELKAVRKDGSKLWAHANVKPLFNNKGEYTGSLGMFTDITKRKEAEEALVKIDNLRKQELHHRVKNNLQVISSLLDLQAEKFKSKKNVKVSEVLEAFRESQDRVFSMALIHQELYRSGENNKLNFSQYIKKLADNLFLTYRLKNTGTKFNTNIEENVFFDINKSVPLGIITNELISNSFKYAFQGRDSGEIKVKLLIDKNRKCLSDGCKSTSYVLSVSDNGIGIPEDIHIENLDSLGLQLVTSLVEQLDGELELKRNNGTEFIIKFTVTDKSYKDSEPVFQQ